MKTGWLWQDLSDRTLEDKVALATLAYQKKHGRAPTICLVNRAIVPENEERWMGGVTVRGSRHVLLRGYFWLGMEG